MEKRQRNSGETTEIRWEEKGLSKEKWKIMQIKKEIKSTPVEHKIIFLLHNGMYGRREVE